MIHPCKCTAYNGDQCYNCLNGAHDICSAEKRCKKRCALVPGILLVFKSSPKRKKSIVKKVDKIMTEHKANRALLCDSRIKGCTCNQFSFGG